MRSTQILLAVLCLNTFPALADDDGDALLQGRLEAHITFLADDLLRGRQPGTEGYDIAAAYVASQFRQMGLQPAGTDGGYLQPVPLRRAWLDDGSATLELIREDETRPFRYVDEFYRGASLAHPGSEVQASMVFAGYGIDAPLLEYSDFEGLDVQGKVVVVMRGQPLDFPSEEGAHFSSTRERLKNVVQRGAAGIVMIHTPRAEERFAWKRVASLVGTPSMGWLDQDGRVFAGFEQLGGGATLHHAAATALFEGAGVPLANLLAMDAAGERLPTFELPGEIRMRQSSRHESIASPNVAAYLPGSDPLLNSEFMVYTAHLDHIGELHGEGHDDPINNGALDNASGTAALLEIAEAYANRAEPPRRTIVHPPSGIPPSPPRRIAEFLITCDDGFHNTS